MRFCFQIYNRAWPQPVLLKQMPTENKLNFPIWDPRVSCVRYFKYSYV